MLTERSRDDFIPVGIIERNRIHHIPVTPLEGEQLVSCYCAPDLAGSVVTARDELVAGLVQGAVCERQYVCTQNLEMYVRRRRYKRYYILVVRRDFFIMILLLLTFRFSRKQN